VRSFAEDLRYARGVEQSSFRRSRFYKDGVWVPAREFPALRQLQLWLEDYAPIGPELPWPWKGDCWLDVIEKPVGLLACAIHGHEQIVDGNGPPPACRWCHKT
jgi:hypothetical protein